MAEFRRQPEWQQDANRHTALIDPVLTVRPIARFDYTVRRAVTAIDHALVFVTTKGQIQGEDGRQGAEDHADQHGHDHALHQVQALVLLLPVR